MKNSPETLKKRNALKRKWKAEIDPKSFPHKIVKKCKDCKKEKLCLWQHSFTQTGIPEYRARCVDCHNKYSRKISKKASSKITRNKHRANILLKRKLYAVKKLGGKCVVCGYKKLAGLTFHHLDKKTKIKGVGQMFDYSLELLDREIEKCQLMCFNCHMELHSEIGR